MSLASGQQEFQQDVQTLALLIEAGVIPPLTPGVRESLPTYLRRLSETNLPYESFEFRLEVKSCHPSTEEDDTVGRRGPGELQIMLRYAITPAAYCCAQARRNLSRIHPRLFGSLLVHLHQITQSTWPVVTVSDALEIAEMVRFEDSPKGLWKSIHEELGRQLDRTPTRQEVQEHLEYASPRSLYAEIGLDEVLPALKPKLCFSLAEIRGRCTNSLEDVAVHVLSLVDDLERLKALNEQISANLTELERRTRYSMGEMRVAPVSILSGQYRDTEGNIHEVQELLEEEWQIAAQTEGYAPNFILRILTPEDAQRAAVLLPLYAQSLSLTQELVNVLIDD